MAGCSGEAAPEAENDEDGEGREQQSKEPDRVLADAGAPRRFHAQQRTTTASDQSVGARAGGERGAEFAEVEHEDGGIERHVEDAGGEREPALLIAPEGPERAAHPDIKAAFGGDGGGEFADHQRGGQAPESGSASRMTMARRIAAPPRMSSMP